MCVCAYVFRVVVNQNLCINSDAHLVCRCFRVLLVLFALFPFVNGISMYYINYLVTCCPHTFLASSATIVYVKNLLDYLVKIEAVL